MKVLKNLLFTVYSIFVVLLLGVLCLLFIMSSQMKKDGVFTMMGYRYSVMDTNNYQSKIPKGFLVISKVVKPSELQAGSAVTFRYTDAQQKSHVTCGEVSAVDAVASPASFMIHQDNMVYSEIVDETAILGMPTSKSLFFGGTFTFLMTDMGFYLGFILPVGVLLLSEVVLLIVLLKSHKKQVQEEPAPFHREENFNIRIKSETEAPAPVRSVSQPFPVKPRVVSADEVLPKRVPSSAEPKAAVSKPSAEQPKQKEEPRPKPSPAADEGEELSSVLASLMEQEQPKEPVKAEEKKAPSQEQKDLMEESSEDIINDILKKLYADEQ